MKNYNTTLSTRKYKCNGQTLQVRDATKVDSSSTARQQKNRKNIWKLNSVKYICTVI